MTLFCQEASAESQLLQKRSTRSTEILTDKNMLHIAKSGVQDLFYSQRDITQWHTITAELYIFHRYYLENVIVSHASSTIVHNSKFNPKGVPRLTEALTVKAIILTIIRIKNSTDRNRNNFLTLHSRMP